MDWSPFVGVPFLDKGRALDGCDCWGLFRLAFQAGTGIELPAIDEGYQGRADRAGVARLVEGGKADWIPVDPGAERPFDAVLMTIRGFQHLGIVVKGGSMLHMPRDASSAIEPYRTARYERVIAGFHRYAGILEPRKVAA